MVEQQIVNWLNEEAGKLTQPAQYEELPSLKLQNNVVTEFTVDFSKPFRDFMEKDEKGAVLKITKIIPVINNGNRMNFWLNVKNPVYREIITLGKEGQTNFKVLRTGTQAQTKYVLVK
jgi:hypothetical protein